MKAISVMILIGGMVCLTSCGGSGKPDPEPMAMDGLSDRLNRNYGYAVDEKGNWLPKTDKRSQYEGRGGSAYFSGDVSKKRFSTNQLNKGSWMGGAEVERPSHRINGSSSSLGGENRFSSQQASLDRSLQTPARIEGNHLPGRQANEASGARMARPSDAETDARRKVFTEPDIIDYRQQRELSIRESKRLLGRDN